MLFLEQALASAQKPLTAAMRVETEPLLGRARGFVAKIKLLPEPADLRVSVDSAEAKLAQDNTLFLDVGPHRLDFQARGYTEQHRSYTVEGGESQTWRIALRKEAGAPVDAESPSRKVLGLSVAAVGLGVAAFAAAGVFMGKRINAGGQLRALPADTAADSAQLLHWQETRAKPYIFGAVGALTLTSGVVALLLNRERSAFPGWASAGALAAGVGLASWGIVEMARGTSCDGVPHELQGCSKGLERRDLGALLLLGAAPLLAVPITQLARRVIAPTGPGTVVRVSPQLNPMQKAFSMNARVQWL
jgi:hypothetical protein